MVVRHETLKGVHLWGAIVCFMYFASFVFINFSIYHLSFLLASFLMLFNNYWLIRRGYYSVATYLFMFITNGLTFMFDDGIGSPTAGYVMYTPLMLCNLFVTSPKDRRQQTIAISATLITILLINYSNVSPRLNRVIYPESYQYYITVFHTGCGILMSFVMIHLLRKAWQEAIVKLKESKAKLESSEQLLNSINQNIDLGIFRADAVANKMTYANRALLKLFGYDSVEDVMVLGPQNLVVNHEDWNLMLIELLREGKVKNKEIEYLRKDGSRFWGLCAINILNDPEGNVIFDGSIQDISEMKNLRDEIISAREMAESYSNAKSLFLSSMSHEIRTPINTVVGASNLLLRANPREDQMENILLLHTAGTSLISLIDTILDISKIELNVIDFKEIPVDIHQLILDVASLHSFELQRKSIEFSFKADREAYLVLTDPTQLSKVITNLLSNAIKFTPKGSIIVSVDVKQETEGSLVLKVSVSDTGIGIPESSQKKIFDWYNQGEKDISRKYGGSGLGLAITRSILQKMNSEIEFTSEQGKGSVFSFELELRKQIGSQIINNLDVNSEIELSGRRILLVDDNEFNKIIIRQFLVSWGVNFEQCESGREAISLLKEQSFDLVLMDLHMPDLDGIETTKIIREFNKDIPIIALTADVFSETKQKIIYAGMNDFISKPFEPEALFNKLKLFC